MRQGSRPHASGLSEQGDGQFGVLGRMSKEHAPQRGRSEAALLPHGPQKSRAGVTKVAQAGRFQRIGPEHERSQAGTSQLGTPNSSLFGFPEADVAASAAQRSEV